MIDNSIKYRPIHRLFIANRGEIALRIHQTAKKMGITTIGIITDFELQTPTDEKVRIKGNTLTDTYLNSNAIIEAALSMSADAIHPGYGFLSENPLFAEATKQAGLIFVGPTAAAIKEIGNKTNARVLAQSLNILTIKGIFGTSEEIQQQQQKLSFPLLIKAAAGGGGKGMIRVNSLSELESKLKQAEREAEAYFGNKTLLVEQYIDQPRHIEVQLLADQYGNSIHLFERECSIQRRYQKIIEESPSPFVTDLLRKKLTADALKLFNKVGYQNAGTVEFLVDKKGNHYFLEVNTRLQVEHPVTEAVTSIDLVKQQLLIAMGLPLTLSQKEIKLNGHALECRIYAEDPQHNFRPAPGDILSVEWPNKNIARTDSWFNEAVEIRSEFDPMLAKIITHAPNRHYAIEKMNNALEETLLIGNVNNISYLKSILKNNDFIAGNINTNFCNTFKPSTLTNTSIDAVVAATLIWQFKSKKEVKNAWNQIDFFRINKQVAYIIDNQHIQVNYHTENNQLSFSFNQEEPKTIFNMVIEKNKIAFTLNAIKHQFNWTINAKSHLILEKETAQWKVIPHHYLPKNNANRTALDTNQNGTTVKAPIPGKIVTVNVQEGQLIKEGDTLMILEAMKMENNIQMPQDGIIKKILIAKGNQVKANELLVKFEHIKK